MEKIECRNCGAEVTGKYCPDCGQLRYRRITWKMLLRDAYDGFFDFESPFLKSLISLTINPGKVYVEYLGGARKRYFSPIKYSLWILAVCIAVAGLYGINIIPAAELMFEDEATREKLAPMVAFVNAAIVPIVFFYAFLTAGVARLFFRKEGYSLLEWFTVIMLCVNHLYILTIPAIMLGITHSQTYMLFSVAVSVMYMTWAVASMFRPLRLAYIARSLGMALTGQVGVSILTGVIAGTIAAAW